MRNKAIGKTITITKQVVFKDIDGIIYRVFNIGDKLKFTAKTSSYFVTPIGGIYLDEAVEDEDQKTTGP